MQKHPFRRLVIASALGTAIVLTGTQSFSAITSKADNLANPRGWSAVAGMDVQAVIDMAQKLPVSTLAVEDQPYCDSVTQVAQTLRHDFDEELVAHGTQDTALWGSSAMGTWTLTLNRADRTSCVVASGIGFTKYANPMQFYHQAGLKG